MADAFPEPPRNQKTRLPPKRGQIKAQIFESLGKSMTSAFSKAGEALGRLTGGGIGSPGSGTPPISAYNSDGNPNNSPE